MSFETLLKEELSFIFVYWSITGYSRKYRTGDYEEFRGDSNEKEDDWGNGTWPDSIWMGLGLLFDDPYKSIDYTPVLYPVNLKRVPSVECTEVTPL